MYASIGLIQAVVDFFIGLAEVILGLRVIFRLFAANPTSPFVHWIYQTSGTLMEPVRGIFPTETIHSGGYALDISALFAMLIYLIIGYLLLAILGWLPPQKPRGYRVIRR